MNSVQLKSYVEIQTARDVLAAEANGLRALAAGLGGEFIRAVDLMEATKERIVLAGIGKSGHVARKITATLASTGTPAFFVHPCEAKHGDLGAIVPGDVIIVLSKSGSNTELSDIITYAQQLRTPLIAITEQENSPLAKAATVALLIPPIREACLLGLAPTTSTIMQMAMGDALAMILLKRRNFTAANFKKLHPGGRLGEAISTIH